MNCPKCNQPITDLSIPCPACDFEADAASLTELNHIQWLLTEIESWQVFHIHSIDRERLRDHYQARRRDLQVTLGLRLPPLSPTEAAEAWVSLWLHETYRERLLAWRQSGWISDTAAQSLIDEFAAEMESLREQLADHHRPAYLATATNRMALLDRLEAIVADLRDAGDLTSAEAEAQLRESLAAEREALEVEMGIRVAIESVVPAVPSTPPAQPEQPAISIPDTQETETVPPPDVPKVPWRERFWRSLLSERTLQVILVLGIFLLFAAALSFVIRGWENISAPFRVAIPTFFTAFFFGLGRYVRTRTELYRSGLALSAIAALLVPIDLYTVYANFNFPSDSGSIFWFVTSFVCLIVYAGATYLIQSRLFGYLVVTAAGSLVLSAISVLHQFAGLSLDWWGAGLAMLALGLIVLATAIDRYRTDRLDEDRGKVEAAFATPFRFMALTAIGVLMPLTFAWRYLGQGGYDQLHYSMTITWFLGGLIFGWGAIFYRSRGLGQLAAITLPVAVYLTQAAVFDALNISAAWHAFGLAWLALLYIVVGHKLEQYQDDLVHQRHRRTAIVTAAGLAFLAAFWSLLDLGSGLAAASSHAVLTLTAALTVRFWHDSRLLYLVSLFSFSTLTFTLTEVGISIGEVTPSWATLALIHIWLALRLGGRTTDGPQLPVTPLIIAGYVAAFMAILPPLILYNSDLLLYGLGNWIGLAAWGAWLAHQRQPGFVPTKDWGWSLFHWLSAVPLPLWLGLLFSNRRPLDASFALALAVLAWGLAALAYHLRKETGRTDYYWPWFTMGIVSSLAAPLAALWLVPNGVVPALCLMAAGLLYLGDAFSSERSFLLSVGSLILTWGFIAFLNRLGFSYSVILFSTALLVSVYFGLGLWLEYRRSQRYSAKFLEPLYLTNHLVVLAIIAGIYVLPLDRAIQGTEWADPMKVWGALAQLSLGVVYGFYAWARGKERWGHLAAWLGAAGGGFLAIAYSQGRGSSATKAALLAILFVLSERTLRWLWRQRGYDLTSRMRAIVRQAWWLYRRPLLVVGWAMSAGVIALATVRNLWLLGGGETQKLWAWIGLLLIAALYALSARLYRRTRFVWLAAILVILPWTILTSLGWYTPFRATVPGYAISWVVLAWCLFLVSLALRWRELPRYARPAGVVSQLLLVFALLWGVADLDTSAITLGLAIGLYAVASVLSWRQGAPTSDAKAIFQRTKFLFPTLGLVPVWAIYLLAQWQPAVRHEHVGLLLLVFGPLGIAAGQWLTRRAATATPNHAFGLSGYLTGILSTLIGTMLVLHLPVLAAIVLLSDALFLLYLARLFQNSMWTYPASLLVPVSLLIALSQRDIPFERQGWWLIGLAAIYLGLAALLRRIERPAYGTTAFVVGFMLVALGLPPSSQDQLGAFWGYGAAALLYLISAIRLRQPLLLVPVAVLAAVPYGVGLQLSALEPDYYGLALLPGAALALTIGVLLDQRLGAWSDFPWGAPWRWPQAAAERLLGWWALVPYTLGLSFVIISPMFTPAGTGLAALHYVLLLPFFAWATHRFRSRLWLLALAVAAHLAVQAGLAAAGWWESGAEAWLRFMPVTILTLSAAVWLARRYDEGSPFSFERFWSGWSRPLFLLAGVDMVLGQWFSFSAGEAAAAVTLIHALLLAALASLYLLRPLPYVSAVMGIIGFNQWLFAQEGDGFGLPVALAALAFGYGLVSYGLKWARPSQAWASSPRLTIWERPLEYAGLGLSALVLLIALVFGFDIVGWTIRAIFGFPYKALVAVEPVLMMVRVLTLIGLLYLTMALARRLLIAGYGAVAMLLAAWLLFILYIQDWAGLQWLQWYAMPVGAYMLGISYLEWLRGRLTLARWLDYAAISLLLGSLFWQTLVFGWGYFLLLIIEGLLAVWWGSARRLRRFLYAGMIGVVLATVGQLLNSLLSVNQWLVFGLIGLLLVAAAIVVERKMEDLRAWQDSLETWE